MRFKILYILFVISSLLYGSFHILAFLTPRILMTIIMFFVCLFEDKKLYIDKYFGIYLVFISFFGFSAISGGHIGRYIQYLVGFYFTAYVGYWSTVILIRKYGGIRAFFSTLLYLGMVDAIVTISQAFNLNFFTPYLEMLHLSVDYDFLLSMGEEFDLNAVPINGIVQSPVFNGYVLMVMTLLSTSLLIKKVNISRILIFAIFFVSSFLVQQRGAFYINAVLSFFLLYRIFGITKSNKAFFLRLLLLFAVVMIIVNIGESVLVSNSRYSIGFDDTGRSEITRGTIEFVRNNWLMGGVFDLGFLPHNLFFNAIVFGGLFGGVAIYILLLLQFKKLIPSAFSNNIVLIILSCAVIAFTMNSLLHNSSLITGDVLLWILWGAFIANYENPVMLQDNYSEASYLQ